MMRFVRLVGACGAVLGGVVLLVMGIEILPGCSAQGATAGTRPANATVGATATSPATAPASAATLVYMLLEKDAVQATGPVTVGQKIEVRAAGNPTTGYSWAVKEIKGEAVKNGGEVKYVPTPVAPRVVGSGGTFMIPLDAVKVGKAEVTLVYARPWEKDVPAASSVILTIEVQAAGSKGAPAAPRAAGPATVEWVGYIVLLKDTVEAPAEVARLEGLYGFQYKYLYDM